MRKHNSVKEVCFFVKNSAFIELGLTTIACSHTVKFVFHAPKFCAEIFRTKLQYEQ